MSIEEEYPDVLQNIESAIVDEFQQDDQLRDKDVLAALDILIRITRSEIHGREAKIKPVSEASLRVFERVSAVARWRLGDNPSSFDFDDPPEPISAEILLLCLRRVRKSVIQWNKELGRQGYLRFISKFIA